MAFHKKTLKDLDLTGKRVLVRVDYNVPMKNGKVAGDYRIDMNLPTLRYLLAQNCRMVLISHLGRPDGKVNPEFSLRPVAQRLSKLLNHNVKFINECIGQNVRTAADALKPKEILLLENLRFHPEEELNDSGFAKQLSEWGEVFIQDGFGVVHRKQASTLAITRFLPSVAGLLLEREVDTITKVMAEPKRPLMAIIGGSKISDKIKILEKFLNIADFIAIGGAMANTFLLAEGIETGKSFIEPDDIALAKEIMAKARAKAEKSQFVFYLPQDGVVADNIKKPTYTRIVDWDAHLIAEIQNYPKIPPKKSGLVQKNESILDLGPFSGSFIAGGSQAMATVVWNGPLGVIETEGISNDPVGPFARGTELIIEALIGHFGHRPYTLVGGGDTASYLEERQLTKAFNHVSTGGGASLELMEGNKLPGVEALLDG